MPTSRTTQTLFPHLHPDGGDERTWKKTPGLELQPYRPIPYRLVLSSATKTSGTTGDAVFTVPPQAWGLPPTMDLSKMKFQLRVESFCIAGVKPNPVTDDDQPLTLVLNIDGIGSQTYTWDSANRAATSACATLSGTQELLTIANHWDIPISYFAGSSQVRVWLSELATPRTAAVTSLTSRVSSWAWHAVLALTPCDTNINP